MLFDLSSISETQAALLSAIFGGAGVKLLEKLLSRRSDNFNEAEKIRTELRTQLDTARTEVDEWKSEADDWREKYWEQVAVNIELQSEVEKLKSSHDSHTNPSGSL
jgi:uncharacterized coiled-coil DUF342 family protein